MNEYVDICMCIMYVYYVCTSVRMCVCDMHVHMSVCLYVCMYIFMYVYKCMYVFNIYLCMYVNIKVFIYE